MAGAGIEPGTPASLVRCSTTEQPRLISTVHLPVAGTTTFLPLSILSIRSQRHTWQKFTLSGLIKYKCLIKEGNGNKCSRDWRNEHIDYKEIQMKTYGWTINLTRDPCITSKLFYHWDIQDGIHFPSSLNYHITSPLLSPHLQRHTRQTQVLQVRTYQIQISKQGRSVRMGGMDIYQEIHTVNHIKKETQMKIHGWTRNPTRDPCICNQVLSHWSIQGDIHGPSSPNYHPHNFTNYLYFIIILFNKKIFFVLISDYMHVSLITTEEWIKGLLQLQSIAKL